MGKNRYLSSLVTSSLSILPMILIILTLSFIPGPSSGKLVFLSGFDYLALVICAIVLVLGLTAFQIGAAGGLTEVGRYMGSSLSKQKKLFIVIAFAFLLGALITCAEPSILIVASQVNINSLLLISSIALGVGIFVVFGILRIVFQKSMKVWYLLFYFIVFGFIVFIAMDQESRKFLPFIFDSGGITTGSATVPFILALGAGIATVRGGKNTTEDSFGLVGFASIGPILTMIILILVNRSGFSEYVVPNVKTFEDAGSIFLSLTTAFLPVGGSLGTLIEVAMALIPIIVIFFVYDRIFIKLPKAKILELLFGFALSYLGLSIFLSGVGAFMSPFGNKVGQALGMISSDWIIILICFLIGLVTILCEPAVHVLSSQIETISDGNISKRTILLSLSIGVGIAIGLSAIRTIFNFSILYIIIPGYLLAIILMFVSSNLYTALAFDSGGTASGPMAVSFVLPLLIGINKVKGNLPEASTLYYEQSFGVVALIALTPILAIQTLGLITNVKKYHSMLVMRGQIIDPKDAQIIHFN